MYQLSQSKKLFIFLLTSVCFAAIVVFFSPEIISQAKNLLAQNVQPPQLYISSNSDSGYKGGLVNLASTDQPEIDINSWSLNGDAKFTLYQAPIETVLEYLLHDDKNNQLSPRLDTSTLNQVAEFSQYLTSSGNNLISLPLDPHGSWYLTIQIGDIEHNVMVVRSDFGAVVKEGDNKLIFWGQDFGSKRSLTSGNVKVYDLQSQVKEIASSSFTNGGIAQTPISAQADIAVIEKDGRHAIVPINLQYLNSQYRSTFFNTKADVSKYFVFTDRPLYMPGDNLYFKGIIRSDDEGRYSIPNGQMIAKITKAFDQENVVFQKQYQVSNRGSVDGTFAIPENLEPGEYYLQIYKVGDEDEYRWDNRIAFRVDHYRKPEYTIEAEALQSEVIKGDKATFVIKGNYFSGQPLSNQTVNYRLVTGDTYDYEYFQEQSFQLNDKYQYGLWGYDLVQESTVTLDSRGEAMIEIDTSTLENEASLKVLTFEATFNDSTENPTLTRKNVLLYPGDFAIYRKEGQYAVQLGEKLTLPLMLKEIEDASVANVAMTVSLKRVYWEPVQQSNQKYLSYDRKEEQLANLDTKTDAQGNANITFTPQKTGSYVYTVDAKDARGNTIRKEFSAWVSADDMPWLSNTSVPTLTILSDKPKYDPGETATLKIFSEIPDRDVLLSVQRGRVDRFQVVKLQGKSAQVKLKIIDEDMPNIAVKVVSFSGESLNTSNTSLSVNTDQQRMVVAVKPDAERYGPGDTVTLDVTTTDIKGTPISGEVAVWSVDKALFELADDQRRDIFEHFWKERYDNTEESHSLRGINVQSAEGGGGCFVGGTNILMANGKTKPIEQVKVGDWVKTRKSEQNINLVNAQVTAVHQVEVSGHVIINQTLKVTPEHIIWVNGVWKTAGDIQIGDTFRDQNNQEVPVSSIEWVRAKETVYNLTVDTYHTYFADGVWVHNQKSEARTVFKDTAYWNPSVVTNGQGKAQVRFTLPDNLTTWVMAGVGANDSTQVGQATSEIIVSKELIVRPVLPNFIRVGDEVVLSTLVHNFTDQPQQLDITMNFPAGQIESENYTGVTIEPQGISEYFWKVKALQENENSEITFEAKNDQFQDAITLQLPMKSYGFYEKSAEVSNGTSAFSLNMAEDVDISKTQVTLSLTPTLFGSLPAAMQYLISYPYGCVEQTTSKFIPALLAKKYPQYFAESLQGKDLDQITNASIKRLVDSQRNSGWSWWGHLETDPFVTMHVVESLIEAKALGYEVPEMTLEMASGFFTSPSPDSESPNAKLENDVIKAYGLALLNNPQAKSKTYRSVYDQLSPDVLAVLALTEVRNGELNAAQEAVTALVSKAKTEGEEVYWEAGTQSRFGSREATTAMALRALASTKSHPDVAEKAARYLMRNRHQEYWSNTFATAQVLKAAMAYQDVAKEIAPDYAYSVLLDGQEIASGQVSEVTETLPQISIPKDKILSKGSTLTVNQEGVGQLYSTLVTNQYHTDLHAKARGNVLQIDREIVAEKGSEYSVAVGDTVTINLTVTGVQNEILYGLIEDQLPAGMIPINTNLKNEQYQDLGVSRTGIINQELSPTGVILSIRKLQPGVNMYSYKARVVSAGTFSIPPARVEAMYSPELWAISDAETITIHSEAKINPIKFLESQVQSIIQRLKNFVRANLFSLLGLSALVIGGLGLIIHVRKRRKIGRTEKVEPADQSTIEPISEHPTSEIPKAEPLLENHEDTTDHYPTE